MCTLTSRFATEPAARHPAVAAHDFEAGLNDIQIHFLAEIISGPPAGGRSPSCPLSGVMPVANARRIASKSVGRETGNWPGTAKGESYKSET